MSRAAAAQRREGGNEVIPAIAKESGTDKGDAMDFIDGYVTAFVTPLMAAYGKLDTEAKGLESYKIMEDQLQHIKLRCAEESEMAVAVRRKGKSLKGYIATLLEWSMKSQHPVDSNILEAVKINYKVTLGVPRMGRAREIITKYYMGKEQ